jgi:hypothetical protein
VPVIQVIRRHQHGSGATVSGDTNDLVCGIGFVDERGKLVFRLGKRHCLHPIKIACYLVAVWPDI